MITGKGGPLGVGRNMTMTMIYPVVPRGGIIYAEARGGSWLNTGKPQRQALQTLLAPFLRII